MSLIPSLRRITTGGAYRAEEDVVSERFLSFRGNRSCGVALPS